MKTFELKAVLRESVGKKFSKTERKQGSVPCVMYGGNEVIHFAVSEAEIRTLIYTPHVYIVQLDMDGKMHKAILHHIQMHPVSDKVIHIDFIEVSDNKPVKIQIPVKVVGTSEATKSGGKLIQRERALTVKALAAYLPDELEVDISNLKIGESVQIKDLNYANLKLLDPQTNAVVSMVSSRIIAKGMQDAVAATAVATEEAAPAAGEDAAKAAPAKAAAPADDKAKADAGKEKQAKK